VRPPRAALVPLLAGLLLGGCEARVGNPGDSASTTGDRGGPASEQTASSSDGTKGDTGGASKKDSGKNACSPLPSGCFCAKACSAGVCDNSKCSCPAISGASYTSISTQSPTTSDVSKSPDVNLLTRKKKVVSSTKGLVSYSGATDTTPPPQLYAIFTDDRVPSIPNVYAVEKWDWGCNCFNGYLTDWDVTLLGMTTKAGEIVQNPYSGYNVGGGANAIVLYAAPGTITLHVSTKDTVADGYVIHLTGICIEPTLQSLYTSLNATGRSKLPALKSRQALGRALSTEIQVSIRDTGSWMDPRSKKDWWQGK
jgi:hypothetical protein